MYQKKSYLLVALLSALLLVVTCLLSVVLVFLGRLRLETAVLLFDLVVTFLIGLNLGWGVYIVSQIFLPLAASPDIHIHLGSPGDAMLKGDSSKPSSHITCPLYLENRESKAGRHLQAVFRFFSDDSLQSCKFGYTTDAKPENTIRSVKGERESENSSIILHVPFTRNLVVYQTPVLVGELTFHWDPSAVEKSPPKKLTVEAQIYTLDGVSYSNGEKRIEWS